MKRSAPGGTGSRWSSVPTTSAGTGTQTSSPVDRGALRLYRGDGVGGWADPAGAVVGTSWDQFVQVTSPGDFSGDGKTDLLAVTASGVMLMYRANGSGGWVTGAGEVIGSGWW